jgi:superfamily I DNA and RNA helicase
MVISRPVENTPSVINEQLGQSSMQWRAFDSMEEECSFVAQSIHQDINMENLLPDDICVICVDQRKIASYYSMISSLLGNKGVKTFNMLNAPNANRKFSYEGYVTLATLNKAKGNETGMVYIVGADALFKYPNNVIARNKLFTAITRAKGWVVIVGTNKEVMKICDNEIKLLQKNDYKLKFRQPSEEETKTVMAGALEQQKKLKEFKENIEELKKSGYSMDEIYNLIYEK